VDDDERETLRAALEKTRQALEGGDVSALEPAVDELTALSYKMTEKLYSELGGDA
jgi:hypothetical protein